MKKEKVNNYLKRVVEFYEKSFNNGCEGRNILTEIGITDITLSEQFRLGYADGSLLKSLPEKGDMVSDLIELGILTETGEERFKDHLIIPVMDSEKNLITLKAWKGGIEYSLSILPSGCWNESVVRIYPKVMRVRSIIDALILVSVDIPNVICGDIEGVEYLPLPKKMSIQEYFLKHGGNALKCAIENNISPASVYKLTEDGFTITFSQRKYSLIGIEKRGRSLKSTVRVEKGGRNHFDTVNFFSAKERARLCRDICLSFDELPEPIRHETMKLLDLCEYWIKNAEKDSIKALPEMTEHDKKEAEKLGKSASIDKAILSDFKSIGLVGEEKNALLAYLVMTSRKMKKPLSLMVLSSSGSGKSMLQDTTIKLCPSEDVVKLTTMSGKALFYKDKNALKHKVLALEEEKGVEDAAYAIRTLISSEALTSETTVRDKSTGKLSTELKTVEGPVAVFVTTTDPDVDAETKSRFIITGISESRKQTRNILKIQRERHTITGLENDIQCEKIISKHHNFQRLLKNLHVVNPYAEELSFKDDSLVARRNQPMYLRLIATVCFMRQMRKEVKSLDIGGASISYVEVDRDDIEIADGLSSILLDNIDDLSIPARDLLGHITKLVNRKLSAAYDQEADSEETIYTICFTQRELREFTGWSRTRTRVYSEELVNAEYIVKSKGNRGPLKYYTLV